MFRDEADMLQMRLEETASWARTVVVEAPVTHRGMPKPLHYLENEAGFAPWADVIDHVIAALPDDPDPWVREHAQRNAAWPVIDAAAGDDDWVIIGDLDEIPSWFADPARLSRRQPDPGPVSVRMRTFLYAVDWEAADQDALPPTQVRASARYIRSRGGDLAGIRDRRGEYPEVRDGGWHFSWLGGPGAQRRKLESGTCHTELTDSEEGRLIADGTRWRAATTSGTGIRTVPAEVDGSFPAMIRDRRCPPEWFRPREVSA
jgi:Glycosyltransferase family 17